jgi:hypothetical protein
VSPCKNGDHPVETGLRKPGEGEGGLTSRQVSCCWVEPQGRAPLLGPMMGELFDLEVLSASCAADGVDECLFAGKPLNLPGGVG